MLLQSQLNKIFRFGGISLLSIRYETNIIVNTQPYQESSRRPKVWRFADSYLQGSYRVVAFYDVGDVGFLLMSKYVVCSSKHSSLAIKTATLMGLAD